MTVEEALRLVAGSFTLISVILAVTVSMYFLYFTAFVGINQIQSTFTGWCPMMSILKWAGLKACVAAPDARAAATSRA